MKYVYLLCCLTFSLVANPFKLDLPIKKDLSNEELTEIQRKIRALDLKPVLDEYYPEKAPKKSLFQWKTPLATKEDFYNRISKSKAQTYIDLEKDLIPYEKLIKINDGGKNCLVCYVSFNRTYEKLISSVSKALEAPGFNGYLYYKVGGFPNPTGREIQYSATPYAFKIFALLEAKNKGFNSVLWIDAAMLPLKDPTPLFDWIDQHGCFLKMHEPFTKYILPKTRSYIDQMTGVDVLKNSYVSAQIIGFNLGSSLAQEFISSYYKLIELGYPFLSCFPEEYVFSTIVGKDPGKWPKGPFTYLSYPEIKLRGKDRLWAQKKGYFFLQTLH